MHCLLLEIARQGMAAPINRVTLETKIPKLDQVLMLPSGRPYLVEAVPSKSKGLPSGDLQDAHLKPLIGAASLGRKTGLADSFVDQHTQ